MSLQLLRAATADLHRDLEALLPMPSDLPSYRRRLWCYLGFLEPWEQAVTAISAASLPFYRGREKTPWLQQDLKALGTNDTHGLPRCTSLPALDSLSSALGSAYVWEGSTLGSQLIARHVRTAFGLSPETGARFVHGYGERTADNWTDFRKLLEPHLQGNERERVIASARQTFAAVRDWMQRREANTP